MKFRLILDPIKATATIEGLSIDKVVGLIEAIEKLQTDISTRQPVGNYALQEALSDAIASLQAAINGKQPVGDYAPLIHEQAMTTITGLEEALSLKQPIGDYALREALADAVISFVTRNYALQQALSNAIASLQAAINGKQPVGDYAPLTHEQAIASIIGLPEALSSKQPAGNYALQQALADSIASLQTAISGKQPIGDYALRQNYGFNYYQAAVPPNPKLGERWAELAASGEILDEWKWNGTCWLKSQELISATEQRTLTSFPANNWWGYTNINYNIWIKEIIFDAIASGYVAGSTYFKSDFTLGGAQQTGISIDSVNQSTPSGVSKKAINKLFSTYGSAIPAGGHAFFSTVAKIGTGTTGTLYYITSVVYQQARK